MLLNLLMGSFTTDLIRPHSSVEKCRRGGHHLMTISSKHAHTKDSSLEKMSGDTCFVVRLKSVFTVSVNEKAERLTSLGDLLDLTWLQTKRSLN